MKYKIIWSQVFVCFLGIALLIASICVFGYTKRNDNQGIQVEALVTDVSYTRDFDGDKHYHVMVKYKINDVEIETGMPYYSSRMKEGKTIQVLLDQENVWNILIGTKDLWIVPAFLCFFGILALMAGFPPIIIKEKFDI